MDLFPVILLKWPMIGSIPRRLKYHFHSLAFMLLFFLLVSRLKRIAASSNNKADRRLTPKDNEAVGEM